MNHSPDSAASDRPNPSTSSWRGSRQRQSQTPRHGWQQGGAVQPLTKIRLQSQSRRYRIAALLLVVMGLFAAWMYGLLFKAVRTPFIAVTADDYEWPIPPNAWSNEDIERFDELGEATLEVIKVSPDWRSGGAGFQAFEDQLDDVAKRGRDVPAVVIYLSMHGVVNEAGEPCLVPPGASPVKSAEWVPVRNVLQRIEDRGLPDELNKLLILDCSRMQAHWGLGVLYNSFADRLEQAVEAVSIPNLTVLNSTSSGQRGWSSPELQGSVFAFYLRKAMGKAEGADRDGNGQLTIGELHEYLLEHVDRWAALARSSRQTPMLIPDDDAVRERQIAWLADVKMEPPDAETADLKARAERHTFWMEHERIRDAGAYRFAPAEFQQFENRLLQLEQLVTSGKAYKKAARRVQDDLRKDMKRWSAATEGLRGSPPGPLDGPPHCPGWSADEFNQIGDGLIPHTLPLAAYLGSIDDGVADQIGEQIASFKTSPNQSTLETALSTEAQLAEDNSLPPLMETTFLRQLERLGVAARQEQATENAEMRGQAVRSVLDALVVGEQIATPADERVSYWLRAAVEQSDAERRAAEDALANGDFEAAVAAAERATEAQQQVTAIADSAASAFALRDEAWAELPYLAQWLTERPRPTAQAAPSVAAAPSPRLAKLIQHLHQLGDTLDDLNVAETFAPTDPLPFAESRNGVKEELDLLRAMFQEEIVELMPEQTETVEHLRALERVLATPLPLPEQRKKLLERLHACYVECDELENGQDDESAGETPQSVVTSDGAERSGSVEEEATGDACLSAVKLVAKWPEHPAVLLLSPLWCAKPAAGEATDDATGEESSGAAGAKASPNKLPLDPVQRLEQAGGLVRQRVLAIVEAVNDPSSTPAEMEDGDSADKLPVGSFAAALRERSHRERLLRSTLALWPQKFTKNPIAQRRRLDLHFLVGWHCERMLDDFRGPALDGGEPFFQIAARHYVEWLRRDRGVDLAMVRHAAKVSERTHALAGLSRQSLKIAVENVLLVDESDPVETQVIVQPTDEELASIIPPGRIGLFVRGGDNRIDGVRFRTSNPDDGEVENSLPFPLSGPREITLYGAGLGGLETDLKLVGAFRGHTATTQLLIQAIGGITVDFQPNTDRTTRVVLKGTRRQQKSFVFILDCSDSMEEVTSVEATDARQTQRMNVAKEALQGMLDQLAAQRDARVGVRFFGHRVGWSTTEPVRILRQSAYAREIPLDLAPSEDVELILPLGRFDSVTAGQVADLLQTVGAWGQTPLYRSLVEAMSDFDRDDPETEKHIVVITDGADYQFTPSASGQFQPPQPTEMDDVVSAWGRHKPAIHIVGFGIPQSEVAEAERDYRQLVNRTKGDYETTAADAGVLLRKLDQLVGRASYTLVDENGSDVGATLERDGAASDRVGPASLGEPVIVQPTPLVRHDYTLMCQDVQESLALRGGESAVLELDEDLRRIRSIDYLDDAPRFLSLFDDALRVESEYVAGIHRAISNTAGMPFTVSIQHKDHRFSPRPAEIWVEMTPLFDGQDASEKKYIFYDAEFLPAAPVPVVRWLAKGWPKEAEKARIGVWCKQDKTESDHEVLLSKIQPAPVESEAIAEFPGVDLQIETVAEPSGFSVRVVEWHSEDSDGVGSLKVDLVGPTGYGLRPTRIIRTFDEKNSAASHMFYFPNLEPLRTAGWEIQITKASKIKAHSLQLKEPIEVSVAETLDLLVPAPATDVP